MRRLTFILAAGMLAGSTILTTVGAASASTTAPPQPNCTVQGHTLAITYTNGPTTYYLGTPNNTGPGKDAILKPSPPNGTDQWTFCTLTTGANRGADVITNRGLALTSRATSVGADVTMEPPGNHGTGFASQQWLITMGWQNAKTSLDLRIRNSGPGLYQTVTTGHQATPWQLSDLP